MFLPRALAFGLLLFARKHVTGLITYRSLESHDLVRSLEDAFCAGQRDTKVSNEFELRRCREGKSISICEWLDITSCNCNDGCQVCCRIDAVNGKECKNASQIAPGVANRPIYDGLRCIEKPSPAWTLCPADDNGKLCGVEKSGQLEFPKICIKGGCKKPECSLLGPDMRPCACDGKFSSPVCCQKVLSDDKCESFAEKLRNDASGYADSIRAREQEVKSAKNTEVEVPSTSCQEGYKRAGDGNCVKDNSYCSVRTNDGKLCSPRSTCRQGRCEHVCGSPYNQCACTPVDYCKTCCRFNGTCTFVNMTQVVIDVGHEMYAEEEFCAASTTTRECVPGSEPCGENEEVSALQSTVKVTMIYVLGGAALVVLVLAAFCMSSSKYHKNPPRTASPSVLPLDEGPSDAAFNA